MKKIFISAALCLLASCGYFDFDDNIPPTTPGNFDVRAVGPDRIELTWDASEDIRGVEGYELFRDSILHTITLSTGFADTGVSNSASYCYAVRAFDKDNYSDFTETKCDTTPAVLDVTDPSPPSNLVAEAISDTRIDLTWTESTDNIGVHGYNIYRDGEVIGTSPSTSYGDTGLSASTEYCYAVNAFDKAGNESAGSDTACATTDPSSP